jgi:hypothetical protein
MKFKEKEKNRLFEEQNIMHLLLIIIKNMIEHYGNISHVYHDDINRKKILQLLLLKYEIIEKKEDNINLNIHIDRDINNLNKNKFNNSSNNNRYINFNKSQYTPGQIIDDEFLNKFKIIREVEEDKEYDDSEEEEKIKNEIKNNLNFLNAVESLEEIIKAKKEYNIREAFKLFVDFYNQIKSFNYSTLQTNLSQISGIKYVKKIIPLEKQFSKESLAKSDKYFARKSVTRNSIYVERQKLILQKRKEFGFFERYENCKDFIDNFRMYLIKFLLKQRINEV